MKTFAQALDLKDDAALIEAYRRYHRNVWPEVTDALRACGITSMRIYLTGTRLFMVFHAPDTFDPARDFQSFAASPRGREWDELMRTMQQRVPGAAAGEWWTPMEEVFDLDWFSAPSAG
ncbi:MAG: L-rhamnose mutarotase [Phycisphaerales bacterium]